MSNTCKRTDSEDQAGPTCGLPHVYMVLDAHESQFPQDGSGDCVAELGTGHRPPAVCPGAIPTADGWRPLLPARAPSRRKQLEGGGHDKVHAASGHCIR
eukprot:6107928-Karenia_brevis.AAC.1